MGDIKAIETYYNGYRFRSRLEARWAVFFDALGIEYEYEPEGFNSGNGNYYLPDFYLPEFRCLFEVKRGNVLDKGMPNNEFTNSPDWEKIISITEVIQLKNQEFYFDYIILASGDPYDCNISNNLNCGLVFNGIIGAIVYPDADKNDEQKPLYIPLTEKDGLPLWGHFPVRFEELEVPTSRERVLFFGKRSYKDFELSNRKNEIVPIGLRCASLIALAHGIIPRYRSIPLFTPTKDSFITLDAQQDKNSRIFLACKKARHARFEHGETPKVERLN